MLTHDEAVHLAQQLTEYMAQTEDRRCLCCNASMSKNTHHLTKVMVDALVKMTRSVARTEKNDVRIDKLPFDLALTHIERCNFHKLRMHGLVAKVKEDGSIKGGRWLVTHRGFQFLKGLIQIPKVVYSFRNKVISKSIEMITVQEVLGKQPYCETVDSQLFTPLSDADVDYMEKVVLKRKKRRNPCPYCAKGQLKKRMDAEIVDGVARTWSWLECDSCGRKE